MEILQLYKKNHPGASILRLKKHVLIPWVRICFAWAAVLLLTGGQAAAEKVVEDPPVVMDRATHPEAYPDFAFDENAKLLHVWMPDIRDADAAVLIYDGEVDLIDCGDEKAAMRLSILLKQLDVRKVDRLFNSHPHHDHLLGLWVTDDTATVDELLICFPRDSTETMIKALESAIARDIRVTEFGDEDVFTMGDGAVTLTMWMKTDEAASMNDRSAQTMVRYKDRSMLFMADMERHGQRMLAKAVDAARLKADIIKYPHHGKLEMADECLEAIDPELAVITNYRRAGRSFYYLGRRGVNMLYTNRDGVFLHLVTDGEHWVCEYVPIRQQQYPPAETIPED